MSSFMTLDATTGGAPTAGLVNATCSPVMVLWVCHTGKVFTAAEPEEANLAAPLLSTCDVDSTRSTVIDGAVEECEEKEDALVDMISASFENCSLICDDPSTLSI